MFRKISEYRVWILVVITVIVAVFSSPFVGTGTGGKDFVPAFMTFFPSFFYAIFSRIMIPLEKIILPPIVGVVATIITIIPYYNLINQIGLYDDEYDRVINGPLANLTYYIPSTAIAMFMLYFFERMRQRDDVNLYKK